MDSVKQIDEQAVAVKAVQDSTEVFGVWRSCQRELEGLALMRIRIRVRVDDEVQALRWFGMVNADKANMQNMVASLRFRAVKSGQSLTNLAKVAGRRFNQGY